MGSYVVTVKEVLISVLISIGIVLAILLICLPILYWKKKLIAKAAHDIQETSVRKTFWIRRSLRRMS
jgi:hypothetical protein